MAAVLVSVAGFIVGFIVGLTGMGGGALMTPIMVLVFGVQPLAAVSSDLMASLVMKPVGAGVHMRHGAVNRRLVLAAGRPLEDVHVDASAGRDLHAAGLGEEHQLDGGL